MMSPVMGLSGTNWLIALLVVLGVTLIVILSVILLSIQPASG
jgi:hypothetical protein